jgi:hypothetical protein
VRNLLDISYVGGVSGRLVLLGAVADALSVHPDNVTVIQVKDGRKEDQRPVLFEAGSKRRLQGAPAVVPTVGVRALVRGGLKLPGRETFTLAASMDDLISLGADLTALGDALASGLRRRSSLVFGACTVVITDVAIPQVVARPGPVVETPALDRLVLGLPVWAWVAIGSGVGGALLVGAAVGFLVGRRRTAAAAEAAWTAYLRDGGLGMAGGKRGGGVLPGRVGRLRRMGSLLASIASTEAPGFHSNPMHVAHRGAAASAGEEEEEEEEEEKEERKKAPRPAFVVSGAVIEEPKIPMDPPLPIERVAFAFPITATTNPYHLMFLGDPKARESIDAAISRAVALAGKLQEVLTKVEGSMARRRENLVKGGVREAAPVEAGGLSASRLLDIVMKLEETSASGGLRAAEVRALMAGEVDVALVRLRRTKYVELADDLRRLLALMVRGLDGSGDGGEDGGGETKAAPAATAGVGKRRLFGVAAFAPTSSVSADSSMAARPVGGKDGAAVQSASGRLLLRGRE